MSLRVRLAIAAAVAVGAVVAAFGGVVFATYWSRINAGADSQLRDFLTVFVIAAVGAIALGILLGWLAGRAATRRITRLAAAMGGIGAGDLGRRVEVPRGRSEMVELSEALNASLERIQATSRDLATASSGQRRFLAEASRGLRAPLAALAASLNAIGRPDMLVEDRRIAIERSLADLDSMTRMVDGLELLGRIESISVAADPIEWGPLLELAVTRGRQLCAPRPVAVDISGELTAGRGDPALLQELFRLIFANIALHTPDTTTVFFAASPSPAGDRNEITVADDGPGIPPDLRAAAFDPFVSGNPGRSPGLGLAVARGIVKAHGGTIEAEPNTPRGLRMRILLPREVGASRPAPGPAVSGRPGKR